MDNIQFELEIQIQSTESVRHCPTHFLLIGDELGGLGKCSELVRASM